MYGLCKLYSLGEMGESWRKSCGKEERKIDRSEGEAGGRSQGDVEEEKIELSKNCQNGFRKNSRDAAQMDDAAARRCSREFYRELRRQR